MDNRIDCTQFEKDCITSEDAIDKAEALIRYYLADIKVIGDRFKYGSASYDRKKHIWNDFKNSPDRNVWEQLKGPVSFIGHCLGKNYKKFFYEVRDEQGLSYSFISYKEAERRSKQRDIENERLEAIEKATKIDVARKIWDTASEVSENSNQGLYLASRGIKAEHAGIMRACRTLHKGLSREIDCLIFQLRDRNGNFKGINRIYINEDFPENYSAFSKGFPDIERKLALGSTENPTIFGRIDKNNKIILIEGDEDALTIKQNFMGGSKFPADSAILSVHSIYNFRRVKGFLDGVSHDRLIFVFDNDQYSTEAKRNQIESELNRIRETYKGASFVNPPEGYKDFNDLHCGKAMQKNKSVEVASQNKQPNNINETGRGSILTPDVQFDNKHESSLIEDAKILVILKKIPVLKQVFVNEDVANFVATHIPKLLADFSGIVLRDSKLQLEVIVSKKLEKEKKIDADCIEDFAYRDGAKYEYINKITGEELTKKGLDREYGHLGNGIKASAYSIMQKIDKCEGVIDYYNPQHKSGNTWDNDRKILFKNVFKDDSIPVNQISTERGKKAINWFIKYTKFMCGNDKKHQVFIQFLAHNVVNRGKKLSWAILFKSPKGLGKGTISEMMSMLVGFSNYSSISGTNIKNTNSTTWSRRKSFVVLEELKMLPHTKNDMAKIEDIQNNLKNLIGDKQVSFRSLHQDGFMEENYANYIAFTNSERAFPIEYGDRRWCVIFHPNKTEEEMKHQIEELFDMSYSQFMNEYRSLMLRECTGDIKRYLAETYDKKFFENNSDAPFFPEKQYMIDSIVYNTNDKYDYSLALARAKHYIDTDPSIQFSHSKIKSEDKAIISTQLFKMLENDEVLFLEEGRKFELEDHKKSHFLYMLGYQKFGKENNPATGKPVIVYIRIKTG